MKCWRKPGRPSAIRAAGEIIKADMNQRMEADIARANELLSVPVP